VGHNTVLTDNPRLNVRHVPGLDPTPVVLTTEKAALEDNILMSNSQTLTYDHQDPQSICCNLYDAGIHRILVEGGAKTHKKFYQNGHWDEARVITSSDVLGSGVRAISLNGRLFKTENIQGDRVDYIYRD